MRILLYISILFFLLAWWSQAYTSSQFLSAKNLGEQGIILKQESLQAYRLGETMTRKEFMKVLANKVWDEIPNECDYEFRDVKNDWWCKYIEWAMKNAYIAQEDYFRPDEPMTKAESMKLILKARYIDRIQKTSDWRDDDMQTAFQKWIVEKKYSDYDKVATRWWIFEALDTQEWLFTQKAINKREAKLYKIWETRFSKDIYIHIN